MFFPIKSGLGQTKKPAALASGRLFHMAEREGFEPSVEYNPHTRLAGEHHRPLGHLSRKIGVYPGLVAEGVGFEPTVLAHNGFQDRRLQPLGHPSRRDVHTISLRRCQQRGRGQERCRANLWSTQAAPPPHAPVCRSILQFFRTQTVWPPALIRPLENSGPALIVEPCKQDRAGAATRWQRSAHCPVQDPP